MLSFLYSVIIYPITQIIQFSYTLFMRLLNKPGLAIIGVSVTVTLLCLPLYAIAEKWQETERDIKKKLQPKVDKIKAVFKGDEQYMILSTYYKQNHYHPIFALRSSFSLLIQIPFFIAAYSFLSKLPALQGESFLFIKDLGQQDALLNFGKFHLNLLPILMTAINCTAGAIYTKGFPLKEKLQLYIMALVFLVLLYTSPSGLVLYWTMNNVFSLVKNIFYKLKNPLKSFYICVVAVLSLAIIYILFFVEFQFEVRLLLSFIILFIIFIPFVIKAIKPFVKKLLSPIYVNDKFRFLIFIFSSISLALLCGFVIPSNTIASSATEFCFVEDVSSPFFFIKNFITQAIGLFIFWPVCFYFLFNKKIKTILTASFITALIIAVADVFIFTNISTTMSRTFTFSFSKPGIKEVLLNFLVVIVCIVLSFVLLRYSYKAVTFVSVILAITFLSVSIVNCVSINKEYKQVIALQENETTVTSITPVYHLTKTKNNVIVIMIDRAISGYIPYLLEERPDLLDMYSGFTYYPNSVSFSRYTLMASAGLWGGYDYSTWNMNKRDDVSLAEKQNEALKLMPILFGEQGYKVYDSDMPLGNHSVKPDMSIMDGLENVTAFTTMEKYTDLWCEENNYVLKLRDKELILRNSLWYSLFKCAPSIFRYYIFENGNYWNPDKEKNQSKAFLDQFAVLDYLPQLTAIDSDDNCCLFMDNETPHNTLLLQQPEYIPVNDLDNSNSDSKFSNDSLFHTTAAAIIQLGEYMEFLKEQGVYDNSRIIIVSDHGNIPETKYDPNPLDFEDKDLRYKVNCTLLVKDFNSNEPFTVSDKFMTNADVPYLATKDLIENPVNPFTGNKILSDEEKANGVIVTSNLKHRVIQHGKNTFYIKDNEWFTVKDNIFDNNNWRQGAYE